MKQKLKLLATAFFTSTLLLSCGTGRFANMNGDGNNCEERCGFGDESSAAEGNDGYDASLENLPPAAERRFRTNAENVSKGEEVVEVADSKSTDEVVVKSESPKRTESNLKRSKKANKYKSIIEKLAQKKRGGGSTNVILLVILAILIPPLAVGIYEGITGRFWLVLILSLIAWLGIGFWLGWHIAGLCSLAAVILALLIVLGVW
ncbi:YqaE/Pmp3 family membrane protein [Paracrocinitomix mangrovi]|uniref:YqaE/Pmp3 family membrane protein n=1 Tax=Paracrocinitomix mangrovi TaxID=2862509 RepID=UPI001C8E7560|nr:YqaE/Pmp3 family membrane protein [Paracrocinitomix mangrovi]UKN00835.1 YqaE/Pmp3 family membrane protein [Paracrocinitomix mangrovi]